MIITDSFINLANYFGIQTSSLLIDRYIIYVFLNLLGYESGWFAVIVNLIAVTKYWQYVIYARNLLLTRLGAFILSHMVKKKLTIKEKHINFDYQIAFQIILVFTLFFCKNNMPNIYYSGIKRVVQIITGNHIKTFTPEQARIFIINTIEMRRWENLKQPFFYQAILNLETKRTFDFRTINVLWTISLFTKSPCFILFYSLYNYELLLFLSVFCPEQYLLMCCLSQIKLTKQYKKKLEFVIIEDYKKLEN